MCAKEKEEGGGVEEVRQIVSLLEKGRRKEQIEVLQQQVREKVTRKLPVSNWWWW